MSDHSNNWIYERSHHNDARFVLGEKGSRPLICIGVNPSTAEPGNLDPTLRQVKNRAKQLGYDGWIMLNLYPQRATDPNDLSEHLNIFGAIENLEQIEKVLKRYNPVNIWAAWGTLINKRPYLLACLDGIVSIVSEMCKSPVTIVQWHTIGKRSKDGHPHHPLYLPKNAEVQDFDVTEYLNILKT